MTRALGVFALGLVLAVPAAPTARAGHYGSFGLQMGFYHYPPPGGYAAPGGHHHRAYSAPAAGYAYPPAAGYAYAPAAGYAYAPAAGYAPMMMTAPAAGCSGAGFAPMMFAPAGGCSGSGYAAPAYGYGAPAYGYGYGYGAPQSGLLSVGGGLLEALDLARQIRTRLDEFGGGKADTATKKQLDELAAEVKALRAELKALPQPANVGPQLTEINNKLDKQRDDLEAMRKALKAANIPTLKLPE